jgi:hypothetical protein
MAFVRYMGYMSAVSHEDLKNGSEMWNLGQAKMTGSKSLLSHIYVLGTSDGVGVGVDEQGVKYAWRAKYMSYLYEV